MSADDVAVYVQDHWSQHGIEIQSRGDRTLTLSLPPDLAELSTLCIELSETFGASTDLKHPSSDEGASCLTVRLGRYTDTGVPRQASNLVLLIPVVVVACASLIYTGVQQNLLNFTNLPFHTTDL